MKLTCKDLGDNSCKFMATGNTPTEVKEKMMAHVKTHHADKLKKMTPAEVEKMKLMMDGVLSTQV